MRGRSKGRERAVTWLALLFAIALIAAACGGDSADTTTTATEPDTAATTTTAADTGTTMAATTTTTADEMGPPEGNLSFKLGHVSAGSIYDQIPVITNARLNAEGWDVEDVYFARTELTPQALAQNNIQVGLELYLEPLRTIQAGGDNPKIAYAFENNGSEFIIIAKSEIETCADIDGKRFGIHGEVSTVSVASVKWLEEDCGISPNVLVIPGGDNRIIALENDELDATIVQLGDWLALQAIAEPGKYHVIDSGEALGFSGAGYFVNTDWVNENRDVAVAYLGELLRSFQMVQADPSILEDSVRQNVEMPEESIAPAVQQYLDPMLVGLAPIDPLGGNPEAVLQSVIDYFTPDELDEGIDVSQVFDPSLLQDAIAYLESHS